MSSTAPKMNSTIDDLTLHITQEVHVRASLEATFAALLMPMKLEPWPGGRWFRDLGGENGHLWAHVQAIKRPTLLEFSGPLFMSYPAVSNVQYRLTEFNGGTLIKFRHSALGLIIEEHRSGVMGGWTHMNEGVRKRAETGRTH
jgi:uncharacterized protein YndB with AHSA1/START domain